MVGLAPAPAATYCTSWAAKKANRLASSSDQLKNTRAAVYMYEVIRVVVAT